MSCFVTSHEEKSTKEFETLLTNTEDLAANISCGHLKFVLMISNFNDNSNSLSIHDMIIVEET